MLQWNKAKQDLKKNWKNTSNKILQSLLIKPLNTLEKLHQKIYLCLQILLLRCYGKLNQLNLKVKQKLGKQNQKSKCNHNNTITLTYENNHYKIICMNCSQEIEEGIEIGNIKIPLKWRF